MPNAIVNIERRNRACSFRFSYPAERPIRQRVSFPERRNRRRIEMESAMRIPELVLEKLQELPPDKRQAVLEFVESLRENGAPAKPLKGFEGLVGNYNVQITEADIAEAPLPCSSLRWSILAAGIATVLIA